MSIIMEIFFIAVAVLFVVHVAIDKHRETVRLRIRNIDYSIRTAINMSQVVILQFSQLDKDKDGLLSKGDIKVMMAPRYDDYDVEDFTLRYLLDHFDEISFTNPGYISVQDFETYPARKKAAQDSFESEII